MKERRCHECGEGMVRPLAKTGRTATYKMLEDLGVPATLEIPTCDKCGAEWMNDDAAEAFDEAMETVYRRELAAMAQRAISALEEEFKAPEIERAAGLSAGYISKIKRGEKQPEPGLVALLSLLSLDPKRHIKEAKKVWHTRLIKVAVG